MTTTLADRAAIEVTRAHTARFEVRDVLVAPFWLVGWLTFWAVMVVSSAGRWLAGMVRLGWLDARGQAARRGWGARRWPVEPKRPNERRGPG